MKQIFILLWVIFSSSQVFAAKLITNIVHKEGKTLGVTYANPTEEKWQDEIFDVSLQAYTKKYANMFGVNPEFISDEMPKGMESFEIRILTKGRKNICSFNFIMDSDLDIDFPDKEMNRYEFRNFSKPGIKRGARNQLQDIDKLQMERDNENGYYGRNIIMGSLNKMGGYHGGPIEYYSKNYWPGLSLFSLEGICASSMLGSGKAAIWLKKNGGTDYTKKLKADYNDFYQFILPEKLLKKAIPIMERAYKPFKIHSNIKK